MSVEGTVCKPVGTKCTSKKIKKYVSFSIIYVTALFQSFGS